jgi:chromosome segregation ATPase
MLSGAQTLEEINRGLATAQVKVERMAAEIQRANAKSGQLQQRRVALLRQLAAMRLDDLRTADFERLLEAPDREIKELLEKRKRALESLEQDLATAQANLQAIETERDDLRQLRDDADRRLDEAEAAAQTALSGDSAYQAQLERARVADHHVDGAEAKAKAAAKDRDEKRIPYEEDVLFNYLWGKRYGTSDYRSGGLIRMLDRWVARLCRFDDARPNYHMLLEIPKRLDAHMESLRTEAGQEADKVRVLEGTAQAAAGCVELEDQVTQTEDRMLDSDDRIEQAEARIAELRQRQTQFVNGTDPQLEQCNDLLTKMLQQRSVSDLVNDALRTPRISDDQIVDELKDIGDDLTDLETVIREQREQHHLQTKRLEELQEVRHKFHRERYDRPDTGFSNAEVLTNVLGQVLAGAASGGTLWDSLGRNRRHRPGRSNPRFGSGRLSRGGTAWRRRSPSKPPKPRRGGGFKTGGSF